jgi:hypothetical protein
MTIGEVVLSVLIAAAAVVALIVLVLRVAAFVRLVRGRSRTRRRRTVGLPDTDHTVRISAVPGSATLLASCDDCAWEKWTRRGVSLPDQERELRELAAKHASTVSSLAAE